MIKRLLEQLCKEFDWEPMEPNSEGVYILTFEPNLQISLRENSVQGITISVNLIPLPEKDQEKYLLHMMNANLFGAETGGNILGLTPDGKNIVLTTYLNPSGSYKEFRDCLEDFVNYAEVWRKEIELGLEKKASNP